MIPWYRQLLGLVFGLGVMMIALWAITQGSGAYLIATVAGMAFLSLLLIFGIEVDSVEFGSFKIDFSNTTVNKSVTKRESGSDDDSE
jgi:hypothetical protein